MAGWPGATLCELEEPEGGASVKSWPAPLSPTLCGLPGALSVNERLPLAEPPVVGVNVTATVQVPEAGTGVDVEHVVPVAAIANGPEAAMAVKVRLALPVFVSVTVCALLVLFTSWAEKVSAADRLTTGAVPVPVKLTDCGLPEALSVIVRVAVSAPLTVGE